MGGGKKKGEIDCETFTDLEESGWVDADSPCRRRFPVAGRVDRLAIVGLDTPFGAASLRECFEDILSEGRITLHGEHGAGQVDDRQ